jgi:hypothetical protein
MFQDLLSGPKLIILGVLIIVGGAAITLLAMFGYVRNGCGEDLNQSAPAFASQAIETIATGDPEAILDLMPPKARKDPSLVSSLQKTGMNIRTALGTRTQPVQLRGHASGRFTLKQRAFATGSYSSRCTFERGSIMISIELYKDMKLVGPNGPWHLINLRYRVADN